MMLLTGSIYGRCESIRISISDGASLIGLDVKEAKSVKSWVFLKIRVLHVFRPSVVEHSRPIWHVLWGGAGISMHMSGDDRVDLASGRDRNYRNLSLGVGRIRESTTVSQRSISSSAVLALLLEVVIMSEAFRGNKTSSKAG